MSSIHAKGSSEGPVPVVELDELKSSNRMAEAQNMAPEEFLEAEKNLKRKLDLRLLACVWLIFIMNYLDRVSSPLTMY